MAKTSMVMREKKRTNLKNKYKIKRDRLREAVSSINSTDDERNLAVKQLQCMSRDTSPSRGRNRCNLCGRSRAYNRRTGFCRIHMRWAVMNGLVPGMRKASW